jgi:hypothetical protein
MNPSKTAGILIVGIFLLLFIGWWATPTPATSQRTGLDGVRLLATNKMLTTISTIQQLFVPSVNPPSSVEPTAVPTAPVVAPPAGNSNENSPPPAPPGRPDKDKEKDKNGNNGRGNGNDADDRDDDDD